MRLKPPVKARPLAAHVDELAGIAGAAGTLLRRWDLEEAERRWAAQDAADPRRPGVYAPSDRVEYSALYLQLAHGALQPEDVVRVWTVQDCACDPCARRETVCVTEAPHGERLHIWPEFVKHQGLVQVEDLAVLDATGGRKEPSLEACTKAILKARRR